MNKKNLIFKNSIQKKYIDNKLVKKLSKEFNSVIAEVTKETSGSKKTLNILNENIPSSEDNILILKTFLYKLKRLKKLKLELEVKENTDAVISSYRPPIFWKDKDIIKQQLKIWSLSQIKSLINKTNDMELLIKKNSQVSNQMINNFILERLEISNN